MGEAKTVKSYRTFVRGLMTEASPLTYPEDTSLDELNTVPSRKGNRARRYGINYSSANVSPQTYRKGDAQSEYMWNAVASIPSLSFLVTQNGSTISFFDRSQNAFASNKKSFSIDLLSYVRPTVSDVRSMVCHFASGKGFLFVVGPDIEPLIILYDAVTDNITVTKITILARDFDGLADGLANDQEPFTLSSAHLYNLMNQGWVSV